VTQGSILEYVEALRNRYHHTSKKWKGKILDEFTQVTGLHRKAVIRLINRRGQPVVGKRRGRKRKYGTGVTEALRVVWEAGDLTVIHGQKDIGVLFSIMVLLLSDIVILLWNSCAFNPGSWHNTA